MNRYLSSTVNNFLMLDKIFQSRDIGSNLNAIKLHKNDLSNISLTLNQHKILKFYRIERFYLDSKESQNMEVRESQRQMRMIH
jgi:hypothetical protein